MPCTEDRHYDPKHCSLCCFRVSVLLQKWYADRTEPEFVHVHYHWLDIQKLASCLGKTASWADSSLYHMLDIGLTPPLSAFLDPHSPLQDPVDVAFPSFPSFDPYVDPVKEPTTVPGTVPALLCPPLLTTDSVLPRPTDSAPLCRPINLGPLLYINPLIQTHHFGRCSWVCFPP